MVIFCNLCTVKQFFFIQPVYDKKKVKSILTYNQMPETDELRFALQKLVFIIY